MKFKSEVYERRKGYGFRIIREDGVVVIDQDVKPDIEGFQPMSERFAKQLADRLVRYFEKLEECETPEEANRKADEEIRTYTPITEE